MNFSPDKMHSIYKPTMPGSVHGTVGSTPIVCENCESDIATIHCLTCDGSLCNSCDGTCHAQKLMQKHTRGPIHEFRSVKCLIHGEAMKIYCNQCAVLVCRDCGDFGDHKGHNVSLLNKVVEKQRLEIRSLNVQASGVIDQLESVLQQVSHTIHYLGVGQQEGSEVVGTAAQGVASINEHFDELVSILEDRRIQLLSKVKNLTCEKAAALESQSTILQRLVSSCSDTVQQAKEVMKSNDASMAAAFVSIRDSLERCLTIDMSLHLQPATDSHMCISLSDTLLHRIHYHGSVGGPSPPVSVTCYLRNNVVVISWKSGRSMERAVASLANSNHHPSNSSLSSSNVEASQTSASLNIPGKRKASVASQQSHSMATLGSNSHELAALLSASHDEDASDENPESYVIQQTIHPEGSSPPVVSEIGRTKKNVYSYERDVTGLNSCRLSFRVLALDDAGNSSFLSHSTEIIIPDILSQKLEFSSPFDENGVFFWIGSASKTKPYTNPHTSGAVVAALSNIGGYLSSSPHKIVSRTGDGFNFTSDQPNSWMGVDLGPKRRLIPDHYCIRSDQSPRKPCNWELQAMVGGDNGKWVTVKRHENDKTFTEEPYSVGHWHLYSHLANIDNANTPYRYFRIFQFGKNTGATDHLICCGLELYGSYIELQ